MEWRRFALSNILVQIHLTYEVFVMKFLLQFGDPLFKNA